MKRTTLLTAIAVPGFSAMFFLCPSCCGQQTPTGDSTSFSDTDSAQAAPGRPAVEQKHKEGPGAAPTATRSEITDSIYVITTAPVVQPDDALTTAISRDQIHTTAGAYSDIPRFLQTLPGVMYDTDARNTYLVNGGNPLENIYVVDGVEIPNINHISTANSSGGFVSMIDTDDISSIKLHKMLYGPEYSGALSSVLEIKTRDVEEFGTHGDVSLGYAGADLVLMRPFGNQGSTVTEVRKSVVNYVTNDIGIDGVPKYWSILSKNIFGLTQHDTLSVLYLQGDDSLVITPNLLDNQDPGFVNTAYTGNRFTLAATWEHRFSDFTTQRAQVAYSRVKSTTVQNDALTGDSLVDSDTLIDKPATFKYDFTSNGRRWNIQGGASGEIHGINYQILQPNGFPSPYLLNPAPVDPTNVNRDLNPLDAAAYGELTYHSAQGFQLSAGGRIQRFGLNQDRTYNPRASLQTPSFKGAFLYGGAATYSQLAPIPTMLGAAGNQALKPIRVTQEQVGIIEKGDSEARLSLSIYRKLYHDYPVSSQFPTLSQADIVDTFGLPFLYLPMVSSGSGVASGIELEAASDPALRAFVQANLASQHVNHKALDGISRPANFDMPLLANIVAGIRLSHRQRLSTRFGYHTGTPYTPILFEESQAQSRTIYDLSKINTQRGPNYARLDLRYEIDLSVHDHPLEIYVGLDNALNRQNYYQYVFIPHCSECTAPYELTQQGLLVEGGFTYRF